MGYALTPPKVQFFDSNGVPLAGGKLYTKVVGGGANKPTYTTPALSIQNVNPVILNSRGEASVFAASGEVYWLQLTDASDVTIWTMDGITMPDAVSRSSVGAVLYPRSAAEITAGVTPTDYGYQCGEVRRYGVLGGGLVDDSTGFASAAAVSGYHQMLIPYVSGGYKVNTPFELPDNASVAGIGNPLLFTTVPGNDIAYHANGISVTVVGVRFQGTGSATTPNYDRGSGASTSTGLLSIYNCDNATVTDCEADSFYNGISVIKCDRAEILRNKVTNWLVYGILGSRNTRFWIDYNDCDGCDQSGAANAYGIMATGDDAGGSPVETGSISFNHIRGIPSWDGIMAHDATSLRIIGNTIEDVRQGIDVGHIDATNIIDDIQISLNTIKLTSTNTWGATPGISGGISVIGYSAGAPVRRATITGNEVYNFGNIAGMVMSGDGSGLTVENVENLTVTGNNIAGVGSAISAAGIYAVGAISTGTITGNSLEGVMAAGGIRLATVTADTLAITGNSITQTTVTDPAVNITGSTVAAFALASNPTNSTGPIAVSGSTLTYSGSDLIGSATYDPASLNDGVGASTNVTVTGANLGDFADASFSLDLQGITLTAWVSSANTVTVRFQNESGGVLDLASGTLRARVRRVFS